MYGMGFGMASEKSLKALLDLSNIDGSGSVNYEELARVLTADDVMNVVAAKAAA
jgi:Ca2+-binding EF-hand superfamily protein